MVFCLLSLLVYSTLDVIFVALNSEVCGFVTGCVIQFLMMMNNKHVRQREIYVAETFCTFMCYINATERKCKLPENAQT